MIDRAATNVDPDAIRRHGVFAEADPADVRTHRPRRRDGGGSRRRDRVPIVRPHPPISTGSTRSPSRAGCSGIARVRSRSCWRAGCHDGDSVRGRPQHARGAIARATRRGTWCSTTRRPSAPSSATCSLRRQRRPHRPAHGSDHDTLISGIRASACGVMGDDTRVHPDTDEQLRPRAAQLINSSAAPGRSSPRSLQQTRASKWRAGDGLAHRSIFL